MLVQAREVAREAVAVHPQLLQRVALLGGLLSEGVADVTRLLRRLSGGFLGGIDGRDVRDGVLLDGSGSGLGRGLLLMPPIVERLRST